MLMAFGITTVDAKQCHQYRFKASGNHLYLIRHTPLRNYMPNTEQLKKNFNFVSENIENKKILSAYAIVWRYQRSYFKKWHPVTK